ncbi:MAG: FeoA family protein [Saccharofermentanales bacterium]|jgi:ferrous iron transport protein A
MMPLALADPGMEFEILRVNGRSKIKSHLEDLGFVAGSKVEIISKNAGNVICKIKDARVALNRELAMKIMI